MSNVFDVAVLGGGHAGCEAAAAASRMGARVALLTFRKSDIGRMSCNPAIGGIGKGHLVREVDALDGLMGRAADCAAIHYRMLNRRKGKAVHGPRVQADRKLYARAMRKMLDETGVLVIEGEVASLILDVDRMRGVRLADGTEIACRALVVATGTFLNGRMFRGEERLPGGRSNAGASVLLADQFRALSLPMGRLKTGTPPRLDGRTIAWHRLARQETDAEIWSMSPMSRTRLPQISCAVTRTGAATHDAIRVALFRSPLRNGDIVGAGPRYCPSIEDKIERFGDRDGHQVFLEPEGLTTPTVYPNGLSTSLPADAQLAMIRSIPGLERAEITALGYAVEYDFIDPRALTRELALREIAGLFLAGQINGTTGYEEAAGQGVVAGLNAAAHALAKAPVQFGRSSSYLGVMVDDLTLQGVTDPYRMLTARAEYRLRLRADNAETRLDETAMTAGCLSPERLARRHERLAQREAVSAFLDERVTRGELLDDGGGNLPGQRQSRRDWVRHPELACAIEAGLPERLRGSVADELLEDARYAPYLERQADEVRRSARDRAVLLPGNIDYAAIAGLSAEMVAKFSKVCPANLDEAGRVQGVTPAALSAILVATRRKAA